MWQYKSQIKIRWISAGLFLVGLAAILFTVWNDSLNTHPHLSIRALITQISLNIEMASIWVLCLAFVLLLISLVIGVPTPFFVALLLPFFSVLKCFIIIFLAQLAATIFCLYISSRKKSATNLSSPVKAIIIEKAPGVNEFAFWSRLYYSVPLRTADMFSAIVNKSHKSVSSTLKTAAPAIFLRMLIPSYWLNSIVTTLPGLSPLPAENCSNFYMWSIILIGYTLLPRIPELIICSKKMKHVIAALENVGPPISVEKFESAQTRLNIKSSETNEALQN